MAPQEYRGNCHCGAFRFTLSVSKPIETARVCNCSICSKKGYVWNATPLLEFTVTSGREEDLSAYKFAKEETRHLFCPTCGSAIMKRRGAGHKIEHLNVNLRTLRDMNTWLLVVERFDGWNTLEPQFVTPPFTGVAPHGKGDDLVLYTGSCHCGNVRIALKSAALEETEVKEDNCSICQRNANICVYPNQSYITIDGTENTAEYLFGRKFTGHRFCRVCGVSVYMKIYGPPQQVWDRLPEATKQKLRPNLELVPMRVAVLDGVDVAKLVVERSDEGTTGYSLD